jgi:hypothetical protein
MKSCICLAVGLFILNAGGAWAQESVKIYLKDGTAVQGKIIEMETSVIKFDPDGPISMCSYTTNEVDSVVSLTGQKRLIFPLPPSDSENLDHDYFGHYRPRSILTHRFSLGIYGGYRFKHTVDQVPVTYMDGSTGIVPVDFDGKLAFGIVMGYLLPVKQSYIQLYFDFGFSSASVSVIAPGERLELLSWGFMELDLGLKPMFPLINRRTKLYLSPCAGFGFLATNIQQNPTYYYTYGTKRFDSEFLAHYGIGLDLVSSGSISASIALKYTYSKYFLLTDAFSTPELRLGFNYLTAL